LKDQNALKISIDNAIFHCRVTRDGDKSLICFHGFGQDGRAFQSIAKNLLGHTIYSFDLPFHGETLIEDPSSYLTAQQVNAVVQELLRSEGIKRFSILAFSIGARLAFPIVEAYGRNIESIWLLAPDGLWKNVWFSLATGSVHNQRIFRYLMRKPEVIFEAIKLLKFVHLMDLNTSNFILRQLETPAKREQVFRTWTYLSQMKGSLGNLSLVACENELQIEIFVGDKDRIIAGSRMERSVKGIRNVSVLSLNAGHHDLIRCFSEQHLNGLKG
jgi:pimeloyl-ACP methyl ester carboxylesterase